MASDPEHRDQYCPGHDYQPENFLVLAWEVAAGDLNFFVALGQVPINSREQQREQQICVTKIQNRNCQNNSIAVLQYTV
jgi:hypothetical protein